MGIKIRQAQAYAYCTGLRWFTDFLYYFFGGHPRQVSFASVGIPGAGCYGLRYVRRAYACCASKPACHTALSHPFCDYHYDICTVINYVAPVAATVAATIAAVAAACCCAVSAAVFSLGLLAILIN